MASIVDDRPRRGGSLAAFQHRSYTIFWIGALISSTGTWLGNLTVPYVLYQATGSALWVGWAAAAQFGPAFVLAPLGGSLADTRDRRRLLMFTQGALGVIALLMWLQWASGLHEPLVLIGLLTLFGVFNGINNPAWQSLVNDLVPREHVLSAVTLNSLQFNVARAVGPAIAGLLLATLGATWAFFCNAVSFGIVLVALLYVRQHRTRTLTRASGRFIPQWREALGFLATSRPVTLAIVLCCIVGLFGNPIFNLTVVFAEEVFDTGPIGLGLLTACLGIGAVMYATVTAFLRGHGQRVGRSTALAIAALGATLIVMGAVPSLAAGLVAAAAVGAAFLASFANLNSAIQLLAPDQLRGRILAFRHMVFSASLALGVVIGGALSDLWGVQLATICFGTVLIATTLLVLARREKGFGSLDRGLRNPPTASPAE